MKTAITSTQTKREPHLAFESTQSVHGQTADTH